MMSSHTFVVLAYKKSQYLEECIKSVMKQSFHSKVVIATSTPNEFIYDMALKYGLEVFENNSKPTDIGKDFDYAISCATTDLVSVAHQDDIYDYDYSKMMVQYYKKYPKSLILFSDYYEIRNQNNVRTNTNLKIKRLLLLPSKLRILSKYWWIKRSSIFLGSCICCPAVTFAKNNLPSSNVFACDFKCDVDWFAWEKLSKFKGNFIYISKPLMGHRVHEESTTSDIISDNIRTKEDLEMFQKFWPKAIASIINRFYIKSEKSNKIS